ncbi:MAG TPA: bifunctional phosphopantothenoylcysteine decarboxylase/phosphopantothenate--cysteine ligase CoaBC [Pyrinomonadaceae bacterium]|jgi:phosphopantothenoylcysteine decarboxylase/phosphopantothenate--cysteine ligase|nr:bifunctional phosphopantothenoylcysteine decarboxylase/phosphopantothenate--cysteine ligase CoaBC [Pyrinomonadaceae bacterium]
MSTLSTDTPATPAHADAKKRVALGVTGGIAAYKAAEILRGLQRAGCHVRVAMTEHATKMIAPLTFRALSGEHVIVDDYAPDNPDPIAHITFSQTVELFLIAPATANIIAKMANGIADDFLSSTYLASNAPVVIAPAMNTTMWQHPATVRNLQRLRDDGVYIIEPDAGEMACGTFGPGRLSEPEKIVAAALEILARHTARSSKESTGTVSSSGEATRTSPDSTQPGNGRAHAPAHNQAHVSADGRARDLAGERFLITAGATREEIDPVRFLSNRSSGRMGFALAEAAEARGAEVTIVAGATSADAPAPVRMIRAPSADEMHAAVRAEVERATVFIGAAAVSDYRPAQRAAQKIKKSGAALTLTLEPTPDILAAVAASRHDALLVIGFAAESENVVANAREKLSRKKLDAIVANDITRDGAGFDTETNIVTLISRDRGAPVELPLMSKLETAHRILDEVVRLRRARVAAAG